MAGKTIDIQTDAGAGYTGYLAVPDSGAGAGILLIQEIFGVNSHIRDVADLYAAAGFTVLAPDVFWRVKPGVQLGYGADDIQKGIALMGQCEPDDIVTDLQTAARALRSLPECQGKIGVVGYCMGGTLAYRLATRDAVDVAVSYYGGGIDDYLDEAKNLHCPILLHFGEKDAHIPLSTVKKIGAALEGKGHVEIHIYKGADHGFNCDQRATYDRKSAMLAFAFSIMLLSKNLS